jgi:hypothetical protein
MLVLPSLALSEGATGIGGAEGGGTRVTMLTAGYFGDRARSLAVQFRVNGPNLFAWRPSPGFQAPAVSLGDVRSIKILSGQFRVAARFPCQRS